MGIRVDSKSLVKGGGESKNPKTPNVICGRPRISLVGQAERTSSRAVKVRRGWYTVLTDIYVIFL